MIVCGLNSNFLERDMHKFFYVTQSKKCFYLSSRDIERVRHPVNFRYMGVNALNVKMQRLGGPCTLKITVFKGTHYHDTLLSVDTSVVMSIMSK